MLNTSSRVIARHLFRWALLLTLGGGAVALAQELGNDNPEQNSVAPNFLFMGDFASQYNREIWWMSIWAIALSIIIFIGTSWALFYTVQKFRERPGDDRKPAQFHGNNTLEIVLIAVPFVIVALLSILTARTMARINPTPTEAVRVNILGGQFWWNFSYPEHGEFTIGNEMVVPAGQPIALSITAQDVLHAFWAPNLGGQRDAIPGVVKEWQIDTARPGIYQGNCTVLCGQSHANMRFKVVVLPPDLFETFATTAAAWEAPAPDTELEERGYNIFMQGTTGSPSCAGCHKVAGTPAAGLAGPSLNFWASRYTLGAGMWEGEKREEVLPLWIKNCAAVKPGCLMPAYPNLSDDDVLALIAYMNTLELPEEAEYLGKVDVFNLETEN